MKNVVPRVIAVVGPTASGKTRRAVSLAREFDGEIISADSRQVYTGMDLGTGKDIEEYGSVPFHLIDIMPAGAKYNLHLFLRDYRGAVGKIISNLHRPILCGGTGMYVEAAVNGIVLPDVPENPSLRASLADKTLPELTEILAGMKSLHNTTDVDTAKRAVRAIEIETYYTAHPEEAASARVGSASKVPCTPAKPLLIGMDIDRDTRRRRITQRLHTRLEQGMVDEVVQLLDSGIPAEDLIYYGLEYKFLTLHVLGHLSYEEMTRQLEIAIHQFAKRQMTWFRGMERRGHHINWFPYDMPDDDFLSRVRDML